MGRLGFIVALCAVVVGIQFVTVSAEASGQKGISAFQRGQYAEALKYLEPASEKGDADAMNALGQMYTSGSGVTKDLTKATAFFQKAAELGNADAQQNLGSALMLGEGIKQDMVEALKWFLISARSGNQSAAAYGNNVGKFLSRDMRSEARMKAVDWKQKFDARTGAK